ncbi:hypothetical protein [Roseivivax sp. CAU 1761]
MPAERLNRGRGAAWGLAALAAALSLAGLVTVGGPGAGRAERRDDLRLGDLERLSAAIACTARAEGALPRGLDLTPGCGRGVRLADPYSGAPYRYAPEPGGGYRLCAPFRRPERLAPRTGAALDPATGCVSYPRNE